MHFVLLSKPLKKEFNGELNLARTDEAIDRSESVQQLEDRQLGSGFL